MRMIDPATLASVYFKAPTAINRTDWLRNLMFTQRGQSTIHRYLIQAVCRELFQQFLGSGRAMPIEQCFEHQQARLCHLQPLCSQQRLCLFCMIMMVMQSRFRFAR